MQTKSLGVQKGLLNCVRGDDIMELVENLLMPIEILHRSMKDSSCSTNDEAQGENH